jgi:hypothetical protein
MMGDGGADRWLHTMMIDFLSGFLEEWVLVICGRYKSSRLASEYPVCALVGG